MRFDELDKKMRVFETAHDLCVLPGMWIVVRLDGRSFTAYTRDTGFEKPFDREFNDMMVETTETLINFSGFKIIFGYTQSDEISLLLARDDATFNRKERKIISVLAGQASALFSMIADQACVFDARISRFPNIEFVCDYFRWRQADAGRNALNAYCYWKLVADGHGQRSASLLLEGMANSEKHELLFNRFGINFADVPAWQRRGVGIDWWFYEKQGFNPKINKMITTVRRRTEVNYDLPMGEDFTMYLDELMTNSISE